MAEMCLLWATDQMIGLKLGELGVLQSGGATAQQQG
jgi:hypothetical protein